MYPTLQSGGPIGLVSQETTIGNNNPSLWPRIQPTGQLLEWARTILANRLARDGQDWTDIFSRFNSGTYNNQWMVVDYNKFYPGVKKLKDGLLWVLEQLPGHIERKDATEVLREQQYWPSYNTPYFKTIFKLGGSADMVKKYGDWFSYDRTPRALIFAREQRKVNGIKDMILLMRYNDYQNDPLSRCNCTPPYSAENAISARNDLNPKNGTYPFPALGHRSHGAIDVKVTSHALFKTLRFIAFAGPTYDNVPPFRWSEVDFAATTPHYGQPDLWKFGPILTEWYSPFD
ncbi:unnamed protein product [Cyprideis torosa]|uniref:Phospholipase B-like n=1 Tax=Cyprideis torosa TaxID=163714 RepID=A0A7R8WHC7_9CRUS|nr:unnamed protein product [Cyprideis torosa]CAG0896453.1 unnamed protein product [Cyprideis torosa]